MRRLLCLISALILLFTLSGCEASVSGVSAVYLAAAALSLVMLIGYVCFMRRRDQWFILLLSCVLVVNIGYLLLAGAKSVEAALMANRIAYLGSVFLPMSMFMIILNVTGAQYKRRLTVSLAAVSVIVFLIAASPGITDIYYREVSLEVINGVSVLNV